MVDPVNYFVGLKIRERREDLKWSQTKLGQSVDRTFQCIQRYENGAIDISFKMMMELARVLDKPVSYFVPEFDKTETKD